MVMHGTVAGRNYFRDTTPYRFNVNLKIIPNNDGLRKLINWNRFMLFYIFVLKVCGILMIDLTLFCLMTVRNRDRYR